MPPYVEIFDKSLALGTIGLQLVIVLLAGTLIFFRSRDNTTLLFFKKYGFYFGFAVALSSMALSLFYSEVVGYAACELCVVQRFFIYPQVLILALAIFWHEKKYLVNISALLAFLGMLVSIYHIYIENGGASNLACTNYVAGSITCAARYVYQFGYITVPVMALTAQVFILLLIVNYKYINSPRS